ncbi:hypothetical protein [Nocardiopsis sp. TNDT3]|jgi:hypothetical protein|uniref:hypothetical protein n=1 Tax=Nocardiopsis TaxID=2013 RepID=UPI000E3C5329|nr:hypothetical protein [Nocardiopsis sp. TNDT3]
MNPQHELSRAVYALDTDLRVEVRTDHPDLLVYLDEFFPRSPLPTTRWTIESLLTAPDPDRMQINDWGAGYRVDLERGVLHRATTDPTSLKAGTRNALREVLIDHWEQSGYTMLHASAVRKGDLLVVIVGDERAGKTTLMLGALLNQGFTFVANDHLVIHRDQGALAVTELPDVISVRTSTFVQMRELLPDPYDANGVDVASLRGLPAPLVQDREELMYYTPRSLGQAHRTSVRCGPHESTRVVIVSASFAPGGSEAGAPRSEAGGAGLLIPHVRADWVSDPQRNVHELAREERSPDGFATESMLLTRDLAQRARAFRWEHGGDLTPLLALLGEVEG